MTWSRGSRCCCRFSQGLPRPFEYYFTQANRNLPKTATLLAEAFYEVWWNEPQYEASRNAYTAHLQTPSSCLKYEISRYIETKRYVPGRNATYDAEVDLFKTVTVDGIITTNWDTVLESFFPEFEVFIGQDEILFSPSQGIAEIYKIHGCSSQPNSLVLTTEDYDDFNRRNPYLAAKLLTVFVEHPVLFLGYSLSDENITDVLKQVASCLTNENIHKLKDRLIFVQRDDMDKGDSFESSVIQIGGSTLPLTIVRTNDFAQVYRSLCRIKRRFSARLLRKMKEHIYELVRDNDPKGKLAVIDINEAESFEDLEVVYGVGVHPKFGQYGYSPISRIDLLKDVLATKSQYDPKRIVAETLPNLLRGAKYVPVFRYLREAGHFDQAGKLIETGLHERVMKAASTTREFFFPPQAYQGERYAVERVLRGIESVVICYGFNAFYYLPMLLPEQVNVPGLKSFIVSNLQLSTSKVPNTKTYFHSLICFYDWVAYGPHQLML